MAWAGRTLGVQPPAKSGQLWDGTDCSGLGPLGAAAQLHEEMTAGSQM